MKVVRIILLIVNVLAVLGLFAATLAGAVAPSRTVLPSLLTFAFLPMLALNVLMVLIWLMMGRWEFLISVAAIVLRWSFVGMYLQVGGTSKVPVREEHPRMVTMMSYNVHMFRGPGQQLTAKDSNAAIFLELVREYEPDVLCLQEYGKPQTMRVTDSLVAMGYNHYHGSRMSDKGLPGSSVVFSKLPIVYVKVLDSEKLLVELMDDGGERFRVCCLHMDSYRFDDADREEIERLSHGAMDGSPRRMVSKVKETILCHQREWEEQLEAVVCESSVPVVVAGDLNDVPSSWLFSRFRQHLTDIYSECGTGFSTTYNGGFPQFRIDAVFCSEELQPLSYKRIRSRMSDHYPLMVSFEYR